MKLAIGLPSYRPVDQRADLSRMALASALTANGINWEPIAMSGCAWLGNTLNGILHRFVASDADRLLVLDDDIAFSPDDALRLITSPRDCVGGDYALKRRGAGMVCDPLPSGLTDGSLVECRTIGLGFSCLSRACIEDVIRANPQTAYQMGPRDIDPGQVTYSLFEPQLVDGRKFDDDVVFFARLRRAGHTAWLDTTVQLQHVGTHVYTAEDA